MQRVEQAAYEVNSMLAEWNANVIDFVRQAASGAVRSKAPKATLKARKKRRKLDGHRCTTVDEQQRFASPSNQNVRPERRLTQSNIPGARVDTALLEQTFLRPFILLDFRSVHDRNDWARLITQQPRRAQSQDRHLGNEAPSSDAHIIQSW
jgi:hypothetical protein